MASWIHNFWCLLNFPVFYVKLHWLLTTIASNEKSIVTAFCLYGRFFFKGCFIYFKGRVTKREEKRETQKGLPSSGSRPIWRQRLGEGLAEARNLELLLGPSCWDPKQLGHHLLPSWAGLEAELTRFELVPR